MVRARVALPALFALLNHAASAPGDVVEPKIVLPGEWLTDHAEKFLFLPLTVPTDLKLDQCKVMSNGQSILVVVTEKPNEEPETQALKKYKLVVEAIKKETAGDEPMLKDKLQEWYNTEDDEEVKVQVKAALDSLTKVQRAKENTTPRTVSVPLGMVVKQAVAALKATFPLALDVPRSEPAFLATASSHDAPIATKASTSAEPKEAQEAEHVLTSLHHVTGGGSGSTGSKSDLHVSVIKESFAIEIPYPVPTERVFMLRTKSDTLMVSMPLMRESLEASGISTGGKPFTRVPVFGVAGEKLAGPPAHLPKLAAGLHVPSVAQPSSLKPLS